MRSILQVEGGLNDVEVGAGLTRKTKVQYRNLDEAGKVGRVTRKRLTITPEYSCCSSLKSPVWFPLAWELRNRGNRLTKCGGGIARDRSCPSIGRNA